MSKSSSSKSIIKWAVHLLSAIVVIVLVANHNADNRKMSEAQSKSTSISESVATEMTAQTCSVSTQEIHTSDVITTATTTTEATELYVETTEIADIDVTEATSSMTMKNVITTATTTAKSKTATQKESVQIPNSRNGLTCLGAFKGTYYSGKTTPCKGGSGRTLINCIVSSSGVKGSVASRYVYSKYGYKKDGRTKVWIECSGMSSMTGWYYVDDCCGANNVIDFYYYKNSNCPFRKSGVISVKVYI